MLLICKSLSWKSPCLLLTATRNAILSSLIEDAYSMTPGLQHWRRMGIGTFSCLLRQGACCVSSGLRVGGLLASLCLQGEVHLVESEKYHATSSPGNFRLTALLGHSTASFKVLDFVIYLTKGSLRQKGHVYSLVVRHDALVWAAEGTAPGVHTMPASPVACGPF